LYRPSDVSKSAPPFDAVEKILPELLDPEVFFPVFDCEKMDAMI
jgi:hypothetical protein